MSSIVLVELAHLLLFCAIFASDLSPLFSLVAYTLVFFSLDTVLFFLSDQSKAPCIKDGIMEFFFIYIVLFEQESETYNSIY